MRGPRPRAAAARRLLTAALLLAASGCGSSALPNAPAPPAAAAVLTAIAISPGEVTAGTGAQGVATLSAAAPAGGAVITLSSNNAAVTVPSTATVASGATTATFTISTAAVGAAVDVTITGTLDGASRTGTLRVLAPAVPDVAPAIAGLSIGNDDLVGGENTRGSIGLQSPAPSGGLRVLFSSNDDAVSIAPSPLTIASGATGAEFDIKTAVVSAERVATVTVTVGPPTLRQATATATFTLRLLPAPPPSQIPVAVDDAYVTQQDYSVNATVLANDYVPEGRPRSIVIVSGASLGHASVQNDGTVSYQPAFRATGSDSFTYQIVAGGVTSNIATVRITITPR